MFGIISAVLAAIAIVLTTRVALRNRLTWLFICLLSTVGLQIIAYAMLSLAAGTVISLLLAPIIFTVAIVLPWIICAMFRSRFLLPLLEADGRLDIK